MCRCNTSTDVGAIHQGLGRKCYAARHDNFILTRDIKNNNLENNKLARGIQSKSVRGGVPGGGVWGVEVFFYPKNIFSCFFSKIRKIS